MGGEGGLEVCCVLLFFFKGGMGSEGRVLSVFEAPKTITRWISSIKCTCYVCLSVCLSLFSYSQLPLYLSACPCFAIKNKSLINIFLGVLETCGVHFKKEFAASTTSEHAVFETSQIKTIRR